MHEILKTSILGLFFGTFGTTLGGIIGVIIKKNSILKKEMKTMLYVEILIILLLEEDMI